MKKICSAFVPSNFISYIYIPCTLLFFEILIFCLAGCIFNLGNCIAMVCFSLAFGAICNLLLSIGKSEKRNAWLAFIAIEVLTFIVMLAYFVQDTYQNFVNIATVFEGAGGIVEEFGDSVISLIKQNYPLILLFEVPAILFLFLGPVFKVLKFKKNKSRAYLYLFFLFLILEVFGCALLLRNKNNREKLMHQYDFNTVVRCCSLQTGIKLDLTYLIFGNPFAAKFIPQDDTAYAQASTDYAQADTDLYEEHSLGLDYQALAKASEDEEVSRIHAYVNSLQPTDKNAYTGLFKGKNIIFLTAESMSLEMLSAELTPTLYHMQQTGIHFTDYYQPYWNGSTSTGEFANVLGIIPTQAMYSYEKTVECELPFTVGNQMLDRGYFSRAYHNGTVEYYDRYLIHPNWGYTDFLAIGNGMETALSGGWPESDLEMLQYALPQFIEQEHFNLYFMTISGHFPYFNDLSSLSAKHGDEVAHLGYSEFMQAYMCAQIELDKTMEYLLQELEKAGKLEDTVIVLAPDHYPYGLTKNAAWGTDKDYLSELYGYKPKNMMERDHNALIIWSPVLEENEPIVITEPSYSVDILPTLLNLFDFPYDARLFAGRDVLSQTEGLVIWPDYSFRTKKGSYFALENKFIPAAGDKVDKAYIQNMKAIVRNKMTFSTQVLETDYYAQLPLE